MIRLVPRSAIFIMCSLTLSAFSAEHLPIALLSVATGSTTLELARPETMRPVFYPKPLPYSEEMIEKLGDLAARHALLANERITAENERNAAIMRQSDYDDWSRRENAARYELQKSNLGKAVLRVPEAFSFAITNGLPFVVLHTDADSFVSVAANAMFVRFLFDEPRFNPPPPFLPNTSSVQIKATLPVILKVESANGKTIALEKFEQTAVARNPDMLIGPAQRTFIEALVFKAVETAVARLPTTYDVP